MHYYVDGYNLIFRTLKAKESLKNQRDHLIGQLADKIELLKIETTLVFDSQYHQSEASRHHYKNLEIYYTDEGETADDYIIKCVRCHKQAPSDSQKITVVTSDLHLAWRARREHALTMSVGEYLDWLGRRYKNKADKIRQELAAPPPSSKIELPKLITTPKVKKQEIPERKPDFDFYMEQFGGNREFEDDGTSKKKKSTLQKDQENRSNPFESDFERWLRLFGEEGKPKDQ